MGGDKSAIYRYSRINPPSVPGLSPPYRPSKGGDFGRNWPKSGDFLRTLRAHLDLIMLVEMCIINVAGKATEEMNMSSFNELYVSKLDALMEELNAIRQQPESFRQEILNRISQMLTHYSPETEGARLYVDEIIVSWLECHISSLCSSLSKDIEFKKFFTRRKNSGQRRYHAAVKSLGELSNNK